MNPPARGRTDAGPRAYRLRHALRSTFELARRLSVSPPSADIYQVILEQAVAAVGATQGSIAMYSPDEGCLRVCATVGYPDVLVADVAIAPGSGIIGGVFSTRRALLVKDIGQHPEWHPPRPRCRTPSFMAVAILAGPDPIGVLCLTDPSDGRPFDKSDLLTVRCLAASAAVALRAARATQDVGVLEQLATIDPVTELFNRRFFEQRLAEEVERARRHGLPLSLLLLDLDDFKRINDTAGHGTGDAALRIVAGALRHTVRAFDICCRYGGDEFALLLPDSGAADALASAQRVREAVERHGSLAVGGGAALQLTVSVGVATRERGEGARELVDRADRALYGAKGAGKNRVSAERAGGAGAPSTVR